MQSPPRDIHREIRRRSLDLLSRREHSRLELERKLRRRGFEDASVREVVETLVSESLCSDARYAQAYVLQRQERGYGPLRIAGELRERGVGEELIETFTEPRDDAQWGLRASAARAKRFGTALPGSRAEEARQARFLGYRGFTPGQIRAALRDAGED